MWEGTGGSPGQTQRRPWGPQTAWPPQRWLHTAPLSSGGARGCARSWPYKTDSAEVTHLTSKSHPGICAPKPAARPLRGCSGLCDLRCLGALWPWVSSHLDVPFLVLRYEGRRAREGRAFGKTSSGGPQSGPETYFLGQTQTGHWPEVLPSIPGGLYVPRGPERIQCERCRAEVGCGRLLWLSSP